MGSSDVKYPWPSAVNVANFVTERTNHSIWKEQMLCLLESQDVLGFVNGEILPPQIAANTIQGEGSNVEYYEQKLWRRTDRLVKGWILGSAPDGALDAVWKLETSREVWLELEKMFNQRAESEAEPEAADNFQNQNSSASSPEENSRSEGGDLSRYMPLNKAALSGDWNTAKDILGKDAEGFKARINSYTETALHMAVLSGKANDFLRKLVESMPESMLADALAIQTRDGNTALHNAAIVGNTEAAVDLVKKNPHLLYILNNDNYLPVHNAAINGFKDTVKKLISMAAEHMAAEQNVENNPFEGQLGFTLLTEVIGSGFFDVALALAQKYPDLVRIRRGGKNALQCLAIKNHAFPSGESFSWWQNLIYHRIPMCKGAQATYVAGDIENISYAAPASNYSSSFQIICGVSQKLVSKIWKVIEHLVPQVNDIRNKKATHQQALQLAKLLCQQIVSLPEDEALDIFGDSVILAAGHGISEIVEVVLDMYPLATTSYQTSSDKNVMLMAASNRFENVFNLIYNMSDRKYILCNSVDKEGNNLMHTCAKLAPPHRLNLVPGAALQMQRELQWFKEAEKIVRPALRTSENKKEQTPKMLFTKEHQQLKAEGEKWMKDTANACTIAAALIATVVFAAAFTVPGGTATENGIPIFSNQFALVLFATSDAVSLFTSITSLLMFLSILTSRYAEKDFLDVLPKRLSIGLLSLFVSITFMMIAFCATLYLVFRREVSSLLIPVAALACLPVTSFVLLQFPLLVDVVYSTYGPGIFGKKSDAVLY